MESLTYILYSLEEYPMVIKLSLLASSLLFLTFIILAIYLFPLRFYLHRKDLEKANYKKEFEPKIIEFLYSNIEPAVLSERQQEIINEIKPKLLVRHQRIVIINILTELQNEVSGEISEMTNLFYTESGLVNYSLNKLKRKKWSTVARGIRELTLFNVDKGHSDVLPLINHPRKEVRNEAYLYLVNLLHFDGLSFLNNLEVPLSEWNQIQLLEVLQRIKDQNICDIKPWLLSKNDSVVIFALKLAKIYNQNHVNEIIFDLLNHQNKKVRILAIDTLGNLYDLPSVEKIKGKFNHLGVDEQISFFKMLEKLAMPKDSSFIVEQLFHENFNIQLMALNILKTLDLSKYYEYSGLPSDKKSKAMLMSVPIQ